MMETMPILLRALAAFAVAVVGGGLGALLARTHRQLCALISLGAGTLLGVAVFAIGPECLEDLLWWQLVIAAGTGYGLFALVSRYVFHVCPACAASHFDESTAHHFSEIAVAMMAALAIHCTVDGLAIAAGHEEHVTSGRSLDLSVTLAICVHKAPEGLALGALLLGAGFRRARMLGYVAAVESTTLLGAAMGGFVLREVSEFWLALAIAHAGGGFVFLAAHAVLGEIMKHEKSTVVGYAVAGFSGIGTLVLLLH
jgi:ZIP family zinc transporter